MSKKNRDRHRSAIAVPSSESVETQTDPVISDNGGDAVESTPDALVEQEPVEAEPVESDPVEATPEAPVEVTPETPVEQHAKPASSVQARIFATPSKGKTSRVICEPGVTYNMRVKDGVLVQFRLPPDVTTPVQVVLASANPNWLGREGEPLRAHVCLSANGAVILQPHGDNRWKANLFTEGFVTSETVAVS